MPICVRAPGAPDDTGALDAAVTIRKLFDGKPLVSGVKALLAHIHDDPALATGQAAAGAIFGRRPRGGICRSRRGAGQTGGLTVCVVDVDARPGPYYKPRPWRRGYPAATLSFQRSVAWAVFPPQAPVVNERLMANTKSARKATRKIARRTDRQQSAPLAAAQFGPQDRGSDRLRRPHRGLGGVQGGRAGDHACGAARRRAQEQCQPESLAPRPSHRQARQVSGGPAEATGHFASNS